MAVKIVPTVFVTWTKAAPATKVSLVNSYLIGGKILAKADGVDKCTVNVFVLDSGGKGVKGITVSLAGTNNGDMQSVSDVNGKAIFEIVSLKEEQLNLSASINGVPLEKTMRVTFRN
jgi:hypothetical protein